ncbi:hypothetical protein GCM10023350_13230 [Nocardioides endophyticus]|uniref:Putative T7SS secretion signal domain-containing protein n=1 Tax=Nocardioides endophyticus TaxID=1353775 RepID=A0ABP8YLL4_9ACTN
MPDFHIDGDPGAIRARATTTYDKGQLFFNTGDALSAIDTNGWIGRAADHFRDAHKLEPERWYAAGNGFRTAGTALQSYATAVEQAQKVGEWAQGEYDRGDEVTHSARASYDAEVSDARQKLAAGVYSSLTIEPFHDPGQAIRDNAISEFGSAKASLEEAAQTCAGQVRAGCSAAPEEPHWWESGLKFVGGIFQGAGEAVWDLLTISPFGAVNMITDTWKLATGDLTPEELMKKYELSLETVGDMWQALQDDPVEFGKNLGKGLLDRDAWADDPARALGHLVPDAIAAVATAGTGAVATRGIKGGADALDALSDMSRVADDLGALSKLDDLGDLRHLDDVGDLGDLRRLDNLDDGLLDLVHKPVDELTPSEIRELVDARSAVTVEPGTPMQRVITPDDAADYLRGSSDNPYFKPDETFGFTAREEDVAGLRTPQEMYDGLGLDYKDSQYLRDGDPSLPNHGGQAVDDMHVLRYPAQGADDVVVPQHSDLGDSGKYDADAVDRDNPFTGNGYTKGGIPEFRTETATNLEAGSEIWRVDAAGNQHLVGTLEIVDGTPTWVAP